MHQNWDDQQEEEIQNFGVFELHLVIVYHLEAYFYGHRAVIRWLKDNYTFQYLVTLLQIFMNGVFPSPDRFTSLFLLSLSRSVFQDISVD